ncbi:unnamed protein product [Hymenolepis diminuta]|uniref:BACK domain-containing protein n=1 Tax=Hymenolepis diminuta TaxID=6216 RepID=A0A0R3SYA6_HYMDI|nr:unnamed protein product [Hymenolepis diminuta]
MLDELVIINAWGFENNPGSKRVEVMDISTERSWCAAVNIPDSGVLFIGGIGGNKLPLRSTELLTRRFGEGGGGGGEKWQ